MITKIIAIGMYAIATLFDDILCWYFAPTTVKDIAHAKQKPGSNLQKCK